MNINSLFLKMIASYTGDPRRIQHFTKVHSYAALIGKAEGLSEGEQLILEAAALTHDIGIHTCEAKYGSTDGKLQEQEGPAIARPLLEELGFVPAVIDRVCYLIAHHHTYTDIKGKDYQILVEADFLVNLYEDGCSQEAAASVLEKIFRTETGRRLCVDMFGI